MLAVASSSRGPATNLDWATFSTWPIFPREARKSHLGAGPRAGGGVGRLVRFGKQPVDLKLMSYWNVEKPQFGADWSVQFTVKFLIPKSGG